MDLDADGTEGFRGGSTTDPRDAALVTALIDQLAAGQSETLYSLQSAAAQLRRRIGDVELTVAQVPDQIAPALVSMLDELVRTTSGTLTKTGEQLRQSLDVQHTRHLAELAGAVSQAKDELAIHSTRFESAAASSDHIPDDISAATAHLQEAGADTAASIVAASEAAAAQFDLLAEQFAETVQTTVTMLEQARTTFSADAEAATEAMERVGANVIQRLVRVLDDRNRRDAELEATAVERIAVLNRDTDRTVRHLIGELQDEADLVRDREAEDRIRAGQQLADLLDRLLVLPRGKLKELRVEITRTQTEDVT